MMESRKVLKELYIGILIHVVLFMLIGAVFMRPVWIYEVALLVGGIASCLMMFNVYDCLDRALEMQAKSAKSFMTVRVLLRLVIRLGLMVAGIMIHWTAFVGVVIGLLAPKTSAYLNPHIRKMEDRRNNRNQNENMHTGVDDTLDIKQK